MDDRVGIYATPPSLFLRYVLYRTRFQCNKLYLTNHYFFSFLVCSAAFVCCFVLSYLHYLTIPLNVRIELYVICECRVSALWYSKTGSFPLFWCSLNCNLVKSSVPYLNTIFAFIFRSILGHNAVCHWCSHNCLGSKTWNCFLKFAYLFISLLLTELCHLKLLLWLIIVDLGSFCYLKCSV